MDPFNCASFAPTRGRDRRPQETGAALLVAMVSLMVVALGAIHITADQILAQHQMLSLELLRLERQRVTEEMFENMALDLASTSDGVVWTRTLLNSTAENNQLRATREPIDCPHPYTATSRCALLRVQQAGTGFVRERVLVEPIPHCSKPYWYAPAFRLGDITSPTPPRTEPVRPDKPKQPPRTLPDAR